MLIGEPFFRNRPPHHGYGDDANGSAGWLLTAGFVAVPFPKCRLFPEGAALNEMGWPPKKRPRFRQKQGQSVAMANDGKPAFLVSAQGREGLSSPSRPAAGGPSRVRIS